MIRNIRTAQRPVEEISSWYELIDIPGGFKAAVHVQLPGNFNDTKKYPVIVEVYGGPGFQESAQIVSRQQLNCIFLRVY